MRALVVVALAACGSPGKPAATAPDPAMPEPSAIAPLTPRAAAPKPAVIVPQRSSDVLVVISGLAVSMNGRSVSSKPMLDDIIAIYGKPDRPWDQGSGNRIHIWDKLGLIVYEPRDGRCISATFPYKPISQGYDPHTMFGGTIIVDGKRFTAKTPLATVRTWPGATAPYSPSSIVFDKADIHVFTIEETSPGTIDLVEISFWQRGKDSAPTVRSADARSGTRLLELACSHGDARMCTRLALIFQTGASGDKDHARALGFAKQACDGNDAFACTMAGNMHEAGAGTARSHVAALAAWKRACALGDRVGCERAR